jgi:hypothetical protein
MTENYGCPQLTVTFLGGFLETLSKIRPVLLVRSNPATGFDEY